MYSGPLRTGSRMIAKKMCLTLQQNIFFCPCYEFGSNFLIYPTYYTLCIGQGELYCHNLSPQGYKGIMAIGLSPQAALCHHIQQSIHIAPVYISTYTASCTHRE